MANRVHALMNPMQALHRDPMVDRSPAETELEQLPASHHAVLTNSELNDRVITWLL